MNQNDVRGPQAEKIRAMFNEIAPGYDRANNILSGGIHHLWRKSLVRLSGAKAGDRVLDCATGTGDLAIEFKLAVVPNGRVVGTDFSPEMLKPAPAKAAKRGLEIRFEQADVTQLNFADASFDIASISFGIRNVEDPVKGLSELARVVRPGGAVMVLEFGQPKMPGFAQAYDLYSKHVLPKLGGLVTGRAQAYEYLQNSSAQFPCREEFLALMEKTGRFASCEFKPVSLGIAYMYKGIVR
ncbi:MAG TPA: bifunctional demethylmenaquinone methyltransferase/2-methoxy-6-polyprenyl-1,4-benzoquinol methylase UbiE [Bdellovibrionales bacterium]|nr:bifunctional demethylmenaquinone methyltransferase/2-methoxy-6-polyprenyl-1,4-benzoquinol methylase UbiE [Bdellovibrionales bacterium]